jgi:hypothetical protein
MSAKGGRQYAQILKRIWADPDWKKLTGNGQWLYFLLLSQSSMSYAGVLPLTVRRWANLAAGMSSQEIREALDELHAARFVVVDEDTEEVLVRSFIRNDGLWKQPRMLSQAIGHAHEVESNPIRMTIADELRLLRGGHVEDECEAAAASLVRGHEPRPDPPPAPTHPEGVTPSHVERSSTTTTTTTNTKEVEPHSADAERDATRPDVDALCTRLHDRLEANGCRTKITSQWRTDARRLLDLDHRELDKALNLIDWCQESSFWRPNIQSMSKFRTKYDQLRLQALAEHEKHSQPRRSTTDDRMAAVQALRSTPRTTPFPELRAIE